MLTTRKLLLLQADKKDKTAKKPIPLYVYCTVNFFGSAFVLIHTGKIYVFKIRTCSQCPVLRCRIAGLSRALRDLA